MNTYIEADTLLSCFAKLCDKKGHFFGFMRHIFYRVFEPSHVEKSSLLITIFYYVVLSTLVFHAISVNNLILIMG